MPPGGGEGGGGCDAGECITRERRKGAALQEKRRKEGWRGVSAGWGGVSVNDATILRFDLVAE